MDRLIVTQELNSLSETQLMALLVKIDRQIACSHPDTPERRNALASYENVQRALNMRRIKRFTPTVSP
ncbi:MAG: hypothetical protein L3J67_03910 [Hyphomicrobiaceae bacterium]|nr:hypothetical protein [Hyphomicrobiaceae bacterium]